MTLDHDDYYNNKNDNDDDQQSWRDLDRKRDRSKHVGDDDPLDARPKSPKKEWAQKMYRREIENLFKGKKASREHNLAIDEIHQRAGTKKFSPAVKKYLKEYGLPDDWSTLFLLLDFKDVKIVKQAIERLKAMVDEEPLTLKEGFKSKLNIMVMTAADEDVRDAAEEALEGM